MLQGRASISDCGYVFGKSFPLVGGSIEYKVRDDARRNGLAWYPSAKVYRFLCYSAHCDGLI